MTEEPFAVLKDGSSVHLVRDDAGIEIRIKDKVLELPPDTTAQRVMDLIAFLDELQDG